MTAVGPAVIGSAGCPLHARPASPQSLSRPQASPPPPPEAPAKSVGEQIHEKEQRKELVEHLTEEKNAAHPEKARRISSYFKHTRPRAGRSGVGGDHQRK